MICITCKSETSNPKFCSRSCAATFNNSAAPKRKPEHSCRVCNVSVTSNKTFCSEKCKSLYVKDRSTHKTCKGCNRTLPLTDEFFYRRNSNNYYVISECKECFKSRIQNHSREQKQQGVAYKGGKCLICGYDKCIAALAFHHVDPSQKEMTFKSAWINQEKLFKELDKCILVCHNCHSEIHQGLHPQYLIKDSTVKV